MIYILPLPHKQGNRFSLAFVNRPLLHVRLYRLLRSSVSSGVVLGKADAALAQGKLIAVFMEQDVDLPLPFHKIPTEDFAGWEGRAASAAFDRPAGRIRDQIGESGKAP